jgi:asparagine synthase (glutamine-hydrolysing)
MCGIAGAIGRLGDADVAAVQRMADAMQHRGPDGHGVYTTIGADGHGVSLAHRRLSIIDLSDHGAQPMTDPQTGVTITFNGEIYNFQDLRRALQQDGYAFQSACDTEVLLAAYLAWGKACVNRLRGMFAFVIWDPRSQTAVCARDRLGIKPLYYSIVEREGRRRFVFASELRALLESGMVPRRMDPDGLASYVWHGFVMGPGTIIRDVHLLPAGTCMGVEGEGRCSEPEPYWRLRPAEQTASDVQPLREALRESVKMRMISDVPLGVFLSGGVDSSVVSALAVDAADGDGSQVRTFNIAFSEASFDESSYARTVAEALGTDHREVRLSEDIFRAQLDDALGSIDQPTFDAINTYFVSRAVREAGITVALAGTGGDELFGGYSSFVDVPHAMRWGRRMAWCPKGLLRAGAAMLTRMKTGRAGAVPPQTRWGKLGDALCARGRLLPMYQLSYSLFTESFYEQLLAGDAGTARGYGLSDISRRRMADMITDTTDLEAISLLELESFIGNRLLRDTDASSMAVSLEVRVPLLDHEVVETSGRVDPYRRYHPLGRKQLLRELGAPGLDPAIFERPKAGFVLPIEVWARQQSMKPVEQILTDTAACRHAGLEPNSVQRLWQAFKDDAPGIYWSRIWALYCLLWWTQRYGVSL